MKVKIIKVPTFFKNGGSIDTYPEINRSMSNAEVERNESAIIDNELVKFGGQPHSNGGTPVRLPNGTKIYSEFLTAPKSLVKQITGKDTNKKYSYSDLAQLYKTKPYLETIEEDADQYQVEGAKIKLANNLAKLDTIFYAQEQEKKQDAQEQFKMGGLKKYQAAGLHIENGRFNMSPQDWVTYQLTGAFPNTPMDAQQGDYQYDYPVIHTEPSPTVTTGVVLPRPRTLDLSRIQQTPIIDETPVQQTQATNPVNRVQQVPRRKSVSNRTQSVTPVAVPVVPESTTPKWTPFPNFDTLPQRTPSVAPLAPVINQEVTQDAADYIMEQSDSKSYKGSPKERNPFGISNELAGTVADIGLALSDKLTVREPTLYNRQKTPIFTRFVDFDDQDVARTYSLRTQQIQNSNMPEQVKQAQLASLNSEYQDYQAKVDFANLQRYEQKREIDTEKLQNYMDRNIDIKVADMENYNQRKARVDELRDAFTAQRKSRVVNALKSYANYVDTINYSNQMIPNYSVNPITGKILYRPNEQSDLNANILSQYQQRSQPKIDLGMGATAQQIGVVIIITLCFLSCTRACIYTLHSFNRKFYLFNFIYVYTSY